MDISEFLAARIGEDERIAQGAARTDDGLGGNWAPAAIAGKWLNADARVDDHVAAHDPARVLREVAAKRKILTDYADCHGRELPAGVHDGRDPDEREIAQAIRDTLEVIVQDLAAAYSDHPDYDPWSGALR